MKEKLNNLNVLSQEALPTPLEVKAKEPLGDQLVHQIFQYRETIKQILDRKDPRLFVVVGPCSIHDTKAALEYAGRLSHLAKEVQDTLFLVMRVYFEKPRTTVGWKGLVNDPNLDDSFHIEKGLYLARHLLRQLAELGIPTGTEALDPISPQYLCDLISWTAIGARTTESQTHREMASGLSTPVGFKNGTDGSLSVAINALHSISQPHSFLGIDQNGQITVVRTGGNQYGHMVLRGGNGQPNYDSVQIAIAEEQLRKGELPNNIVVDCSHANSSKNPSLQPLVLENCINQVLEGNQSLVGFMLESHLQEGNQPIPTDLSKLRYGVSVTDACINWSTTERILLQAHTKLKGLALRSCQG